MKQRFAVLVAVVVAFFAAVSPVGAMPQATATVMKAVDAAPAETPAYVWTVQYYHRHHRRYNRRHHHFHR